MSDPRSTLSVTESLAEKPQRTRVPTTYWIWLAGLGWTSTGLNLLHFGMVWEAATHSPALAGIVLLVAILPRASVSLLGGSIADRLGPLKVMMVADAAIAIVMTGLLILLLLQGASPALLLTAAAVLGITDAFYQPSAGGVPKFLVPSGGLPRALSARQLVTYAAGVAGPVLGGAVVSAVGLPLVFGLGVAGFSGMLVILIVMRTRVSFAPAAETEPGSSQNAISQAKAGITLVWESPLLRSIALLTAGFATFVLPVTSLLIPVLATHSGWSAGVAGAASGAYGAGMAMAAIFVMVTRGARKPGVAAILGMATAGVGVTALAVAPNQWAAVGFSLLAGIGTGIFATHLGPVFMAAVPPQVAGRSQAVLLMAQTLPLLVVHPMIGWAAEYVTPSLITAVWGAGALLVAAMACISRGLRTTLRPS